MQFFGILGIIQKMEQVYMFYMLPKIHLQGIHFKNFIQLFIIFYQSDASIKYEDAKTNSNGEYSIKTFISDINKNKFILQIFSIDYYKTTFNITPHFYIFSIYQGKRSIADIVDNIVIKAYIMNVQNSYLSPVHDEVNIKIFYMLINT